MGLAITGMDVRDPPGFPLPPAEELRPHFPFPDLREHQLEALRAIVGAYQAGFRMVILEAPTGFGKSPLAVALARWVQTQGERAFLVASSKHLQDQYIRDFSSVTVKGRGNFGCLERRGSCEARMHFPVRCRHVPFPSDRPEGKRLAGKSDARGPLLLREGEELCPYWAQKCAALGHAFPLFNYDYFLHETQHVGDFGPRDLAVFDEAHAMEAKLMGFIGFEISSPDLRDVGGHLPELDLTPGEWVSTLREWRDRFQQEVAKQEERMASLAALELEQLVRLRELAQKCDFLAGEFDCSPELWAATFHQFTFRGRQARKASFKPIDVRKWGTHYFSMGRRFLLQSATILDPQALCASLGWEGEALFLRVPSTFPAERRPFLYRPVGRMSRASQEETMPRLLEGIKDIMAAHPEEKGVIHTHSRRIQLAVKTGILSDRLVANLGQDSWQATFQAFSQSAKPLVLVTPSAYEGVDLKDDLCRWQVLCKVPYPSLEELQVRKRLERDPGWYAWLTALRLVQTYGRGMRSAQDSCRTYILDADFSWFYARHRQLFPEWFQEAVRTEASA